MTTTFDVSKPTDPLSKMHWFALALLLAAIYFPVLTKWLADLWNDPNYSHGLLIPFLSAYFVKKRLPEIRQDPAEIYLPAFLIVVSALFLYIVSHIGSEFFTQRLSFILLLYGSLFFLGGKFLEQKLRFPILILLFAVPLPYILYNSVAFPLKLVATKLAVILISLTGRSVFADGNVIHLTHTTLEVVDACSGIRSLMTLLTLAFFLAYFFADHWWKRIFIFALTLPITLAANALRVTTSAVLTSYNPLWGEGFLHEFEGWVVFVISFAALAGIAMLLNTRKE